MNVTASKVLLGLSLAAYMYCSWDYLFAAKKPPVAAAVKGKELTAGMVNRAVVLSLKRDPFESVPLERTAGADKKDDPALPVESGKELPDLNLQGVLISVGVRVAVVNGTAMHEGDIVESAPGGPMIRARRIGVGYVVIEGAGKVVTLRLDEPIEKAKPEDGLSKHPEKKLPIGSVVTVAP